MEVLAEQLISARFRHRQIGVASMYMACRAMLARSIRRIVRWHPVGYTQHEAFVRSFEAEGRKQIGDARAFLMRTARNVALDQVSNAGYRRTGSLDGMDAEQFMGETAKVEARVDGERRFLALCEAVGGLPEQCRRVFVLRKIYGLTQDEIATRLGIATNTVEKHIARGLLLCQEQLALQARRSGSSPQ